MIHLALTSATIGLLAGIASLVYLFSQPGPLTMCTIGLPPHCIAAHLSGPQYFTGDSQAASVWSLTVDVVGPLLAVGAAFFHLRRRFTSALALAALACVPYAAFLVDTYAVMPLHPLVAGAVLLTFVAVSLGTTRAVWRPRAI